MSSDPADSMDVLGKRTHGELRINARKSLKSYQKSYLTLERIKCEEIRPARAEAERTDRQLMVD